MPNARPSLGIIGAGRVGSTLAALLTDCGYPVTAVWSRRHTTAQQVAQRLGLLVETDDLLAVLQRAQLVFLTVSDDAIAPLVQHIAQSGKSFSCAVVHTSGASAAEILAPLTACGITIGALHPAYPFASPFMPSLSGVTFAIEAADATLHAQLSAVVDALGGQAITLAPHDRPTYHAALVLASNYAVTLYAAAHRLLTQLGAEKPAVDSALLALLSGTIDNIRTKGIPDALTGPLVRADLGTLTAHLDALTSDPPTRAAYRALADLTLPLAEARGVETTAIRALLHQKE
ncbi:MAG: DUF2520 domain-containing protein [Anaerolineae bacterium]|nr:DUF2520 domain-containing protein [Anaerolineae bacterium]